jgi:hypothetical protein
MERAEQLDNIYRNVGAIFSVGIPPTRFQLYPPKSLSEPDLDLQI